MVEWINPFKKQDLRAELGSWLQKEVENLENLQAVGGRLSFDQQRRLNALKKMNECMPYGGERSAFRGLDPFSQIDIKRRFPGYFDDPTPFAKPLTPEPKPLDPLGEKPFPPWKSEKPERKPWDPPDLESFLPPWK